MRSYLKHFLTSESGAVTVDWVVLTAAVVGLGLSVLTGVTSETQNVSNRIGSHMSDMELPEY